MFSKILFAAERSHSENNHRSHKFSWFQENEDFKKYSSNWNMFTQCKRKGKRNKYKKYKKWKIKEKTNMKKEQD